jgi:hypothetical protein
MLNGKQLRKKERQLVLPHHLINWEFDFIHQMRILQKLISYYKITKLTKREQKII